MADENKIKQNIKNKMVNQLCLYNKKNTCINLKYKYINKHVNTKHKTMHIFINKYSLTFQN